MKIKLVCLNVWFGGKLFDEIQAFIAHENADIVALQEVYHAEDYPPEQEWHMVSALARLLNYPYFAYAPAFGKIWDNGRRTQSGNALLSRHPFRTALSTWFDVPYNGFYQETKGDYQYTPRNLQHGEIMIGQQVLHVFNTQGIWGFDGDDNERRLNMGKIIAREVAGKKPALLTGDFNVQEGTQTIAQVETHMKSVFKGQLKSSFNMRHKTKPGFASAIVDMMFASPDVTIGKHYASDANVSDHLALVGEFEIPD